jgi:acyl-coenzyme A thioesterase PaaI-like protein
LKSLWPMHPKETKHCFICGPDNPKGLKLKPYVEDEKAVVASCIVPDHLCGIKGFVQGGILCAMLDCISGWTIFALRGRPALTTKIIVRLLRPVFGEEKISLRGEIMSEEDMIILS